MLRHRRLKVFTIKCFHHFPNKLFKVARKLGALPSGRDRQVVARFESHTIMRERFKTKDDEELVCYFQKTKTVLNPLPRRFQELILLGETISEQRRKRYRQEAYRNLHLTRLDVLDQLLNEIIIQANLPEGEKFQHAAAILSATSKNKRAAKRFLRAYVSGQYDYVKCHPRTQQWIRSHTHVDLELWLTGISFVCELEGYGPVRIELEQDPLEVWKLGTYVQSCLSAGGVNAQYAAAVVLDINKQVLYARDSEGSVIGRQLLAISEERNLVCFSVYPQNVKAPIRNLFREYDRKFACALRLPIYRGNGPYTIREILSQDWYDDDPWNPKAI